MNCKNCQSPFSNSHKYCYTCGAKIIRDRFSLKLLWEDVSKEVFGWDTKYFVTLKHLILKPEIILKEYLDGTRKRYVNPVTFLTIGAALSVLCFSLFSDDYKTLMGNLTTPPIEIQDSTQIATPIPLEEGLGEEKEAGIQKIEKAIAKAPEPNTKVQDDMLRYFNIITYLTLPFYSLFAFWTFGKPYNYAEHLVINCYLQGLLFLVGIIGFFLSIALSPSLYGWSLLSGIAYYSYAYGKLYKHSWGQVILKLLKFLGFLLGIVVLIFLAGFLYATLTNA